MVVTKEVEVGGKTFSYETGRFAKQADGAVMVRYADTMVLATVVSAKETKEAYDIKKDPRYRELNNQLAMTDIDITRLAAGERSIVGQIDKYRARIEQTPAREQDMAVLQQPQQLAVEEFQHQLVHQHLKAMEPATQ